MVFELIKRRLFPPRVRPTLHFFSLSRSPSVIVTAAILCFVILSALLTYISLATVVRSLVAVLTWPLAQAFSLYLAIPIPGHLKALVVVLGILATCISLSSKPAPIVRRYDDLEACPCHRQEFPGYDDPFLRPDHPYWAGDAPEDVVRGEYTWNPPPAGAQLDVRAELIAARRLRRGRDVMDGGRPGLSAATAYS